MPRKIKKKDRQRSKRQQRKREIVRMKNISPSRRFGESGKLVACYINENWRSSGCASMFVLRHVDRIGYAMAAFYVDLWCMGIKDAWGRFDFSLREFNENVIERASQDIHMVRVDLDVIKRIVSGGLRFAELNGFRLPAHYQRWTKMLGDFGDWKSANLTDFGIEGKLRFVGNMEDLSRRLIGSSVEEFLTREDVDYVLGDDHFTRLDDEESKPEESDDNQIADFTNAVRKWCFANRLIPHPMLSKAVDILLETALQAAPYEDEDQIDPEFLDQSYDIMKHLFSAYDPEELTGFETALAQLSQFVDQFDGSDEMFAAIADGKYDSSDDSD